jgi:integrase
MFMSDISSYLSDKNKPIKSYFRMSIRGVQAWLQWVTNPRELPKNNYAVSELSGTFVRVNAGRKGNRQNSTCPDSRAFARQSRWRRRTSTTLTAGAQFRGGQGEPLLRNTEFRQNQERESNIFMADSRPLTSGEERHLVRHIRRINARDRALIAAQLFLGFRISEIIALRVGHVWHHGQIRARVALPPRFLKGHYGRTRTIPIGPELHRALASCLKRREAGQFAGFRGIGPRGGGFRGGLLRPKDARVRQAHRAACAGTNSPTEWRVAAWENALSRQTCLAPRWVQYNRAIIASLKISAVT